MLNQLTISPDLTDYFPLVYSLAKYLKCLFCLTSRRQTSYKAMAIARKRLETISPNRFSYQRSRNYHQYQMKWDLLLVYLFIYTEKMWVYELKLILSDRPIINLYMWILKNRPEPTNLNWLKSNLHGYHLLKAFYLLLHHHNYSPLMSLLPSLRFCTTLWTARILFYRNHSSTRSSKLFIRRRK